MFQNSWRAGWRSRLLAALLASYMTISITIQHHEMNTFLWVIPTSNRRLNVHADNRHRILQLNFGTSQTIVPGYKLVGSLHPKAEYECFVIDL
jgi:hypothetical protein